MILTQKDIDDFVDHYSDLQVAWHRSYKDGNDGPQEWHMARCLGWLNTNPQVLLAAGLSEYVPSHKLREYRLLVQGPDLENRKRPAFRTAVGDWLVPFVIPAETNEPIAMLSLNALLRDEAASKPPWCSVTEWRAFKGRLGETDEEANGPFIKAEVPFRSVSAILELASAFLKSPCNDNTVFVSPSIWTPDSSQRIYSSLKGFSLKLLKELRSGKKSLGELSWSEFEDLIVFLLHSSGLEVQKATESPQGGRDIIARGSLVPGLAPLTVAVEVKHRALIDRPEVQQAIHQNRTFPALLFVTSGQFTSGAIREALMPENRLRLFLEDGTAVRTLLHKYPLIRAAGWPNKGAAPSAGGRHQLAIQTPRTRPRR